MNVGMQRHKPMPHAAWMCWAQVMSKWKKELMQPDEYYILHKIYPK